MINYPKYSDIDEDIDDVLRDYLEKFVITHRKLPMTEYIILNLEEDFTTEILL